MYTSDPDSLSIYQRRKNITPKERNRLVQEVESNQKNIKRTKSQSKKLPRLSEMALGKLLNNRWKQVREKPSYVIIKLLLQDLECILSSSSLGDLEDAQLQALVDNSEHPVDLPFSFQTMFMYLWDSMAILMTAHNIASRMTITAEINEDAIIYFILVCNINAKAVGATHGENDYLGKFLVMMEQCLFCIIITTNTTALAQRQLDEGLWPKWSKMETVKEAFYKYGDKQTCTICLGDAMSDSNILCLDSCNHIFCRECFLEWKKMS